MRSIDDDADEMDHNAKIAFLLLVSFVIFIGGIWVIVRLSLPPIAPSQAKMATDLPPIVAEPSATPVQKLEPLRVPEPPPAPTPIPAATEAAPLPTKTDTAQIWNDWLTYYTLKLDPTGSAGPPKLVDPPPKPAIKRTPVIHQHAQPEIGQQPYTGGCPASLGAACAR